MTIINKDNADAFLATVLAAQLQDEMMYAIEQSGKKEDVIVEIMEQRYTKADGKLVGCRYVYNWETKEWDKDDRTIPLGSALIDEIAEADYSHFRWILNYHGVSLQTNALYPTFEDCAESALGWETPERLLKEDVKQD